LRNRLAVEHPHGADAAIVLRKSRRRGARLETPDETRVLKKGKFEIVRRGGLTIGRTIYEPGWQWSEDVGT